MEFSTQVTEYSGVPVVSPVGEIDLHTAPEFRGMIEAAIAHTDSRGSVIVVDLRRVDFMDSSGLGVLIGCHRRLEDLGGELRIVVGEGPAVKILRVTSLDTVFKIFHSTRAATDNLHNV